MATPRKGDTGALSHTDHIPLALCDMRTLYLRNVPDDVVVALEELARAESMSVSAVAVRELKRSVAFRSNAALLQSVPTSDVDLAAVVSAVRSVRDR